MILEVITKASVADSYAHTEAIQGEVIRENVTDPTRGVTNHYWSDEMLATFEKTWLEVVEEKKSDPMFYKVWIDFEAFDRDYDYWAALGYLPRPNAPK